MSVSEIGFWLFGAGVIVFALLMVTRKSAISSALLLVMTFMCLSGLYLTLHAQFLAVIQVAVYAGAIMVLVLFVIMLLNLQREGYSIAGNWKTGIGILAVLGLLAQVLAAIFASGSSLPQSLSARATELGTVESVGRTLYTSYAFPFEMASIILISAAVGAIILAKKHLT
jgi:NADH-quinone oxidoreductase subunit J